MQDQADVIIIGGGIAGVTSALSLSQMGFHVVLVERDRQLGGNALTVCCKAIDGNCQLCGGCLVSDRLADLEKQEQATVLTGTTLAQLDRTSSGYLANLTSNGSGSCQIHAKAIIMATGFEHVDAHTKGPYGYGILPCVTTGEEVERRLTEEGQFAYDGRAPKRIAFIQCVGSRDAHAGRGYCSQVCCRYAIRLARLFKSRFSDVDVTIYKMDIQNAGRDFGAWQAAQEEGIRIISGLPAIVRRSEQGPLKAVFLYDDIIGDEIVSEEYDLVVLATGIQPRSEAPQVAEMLGINLDTHGFFGAQADGISTLAPGVFLAGCCQAPRSISESIAHAQVVAQTCRAYLEETRS